jgi:hypothetical protein
MSPKGCSGRRPHSGSSAIGSPALADEPPGDRTASKRSSVDGSESLSPQRSKLSTTYPIGASSRIVAGFERDCTTPRGIATSWALEATVAPDHTLPMGAESEGTGRQYFFDASHDRRADSAEARVGRSLGGCPIQCLPAMANMADTAAPAETAASTQEAFLEMSAAVVISRLVIDVSSTRSYCLLQNNTVAKG